MIDLRRAKSYCCEDIKNIENYEIAINSNLMYECHHKDEIKTLPSGIKVIRSKEELIENGRYYNCPANELIFMTQNEHRIYHNKNRTLNVIEKLKSWCGRKQTTNHKKAMKLVGEKYRLYKQHNPNISYNEFRKLLRNKEIQ